MQLSNRRLAESLTELLHRLSVRPDMPADAVHDLSIATLVVGHVNQANQSDGDAVRDYAARLASLAQDMLASPYATDDSTRTRLSAVRGHAEAIALTPVAGEPAKQALTGLLSKVDANFMHITTDSPDMATPLFAAYASRLLDLHSHVPLFASTITAQQTEILANEKLTEANLGAYMRSKLADSSATVTNIVALPGGFGKETTLFTLSSERLRADLVMRRDPPIDALDGLDCHCAAKEFPLLKAVHARDFPAPEPLFFEARTSLLPGSAFTIMRRAPGAVAGDATGGASRVAPALQRSLADIVARLHNVSPITELSGNPVFEPLLWKKSASECTRAYIGTWHRQFMATRHSPTPVLQGLFHWLLANIPQSEAASTLIHGDIGFHNLLFHEGKISGVLDWEFGHVGDPAEDLGYIRSVMGTSLDWELFLDAYQGSGRPIPGEERIRFFEIWSHTRNAAASVMMTDLFEAGRYRDIKYAMLALRYVPHFIARAHALIAETQKAG